MRRTSRRTSANEFLQVSVILVLFLPMVQVLVTSGRNPCVKMYRSMLTYRCDESACVPCRPGYGVVQQCRGSTKTVCEACVAGVNYSDTSNPYEICLPVGMCSENRVVDVPATSEHDIKCKCKDGYVENLEGSCEYIPVLLTYKTQSSASPTTTSLQSIVTSTQLVSPFTTGSNKETETRQTMQASSASMVSPMAEAVASVTQPPRTKHPTSRGGSSVSSMIKMPVASVTQPPHTKHPTSHGGSLNPHIIENGMSSTVYIVIGVCVVVVVLITTAVVTVACYYYRMCCLKWSGKKQDDEEQLVGQQSDRHGCVKVSCVGSKYELTADVVASWLPWRHYVWTKDGAVLHPSSHADIQNTTITFHDVSPDDAGEYCCKNRNGDSKHRIEFVVKEDLLPNYRPSEGTPTVLKFLIHSTSLTWSYQWYCNGQPLQSTNSNCSGRNTSTLTVERITGCMKYWCVAKSEDSTLTFKSTVATVMTIGTHPETTNTDLNSEGEPELPSEIRCDAIDFGYSHLKDQERDGQSNVTTETQSAAWHHVDHSPGLESSEAGLQGVVLETMETSTEFLPQEVTENHPQPFGTPMPEPLSLRSTKGKIFSCVNDLTEAAVNQLAISLQARPERYPESLYAIAEEVGVNVDKVKSCVSTHSNPARFILVELRAKSPDYHLSALCATFVRNDRPECARKLSEYLREAGGTLHLPQSLLYVLYPQNVPDKDTPNDDHGHGSLLVSVGSAVYDETSPLSSEASFTEDSKVSEDVIPPSPPPLSQVYTDRFFVPYSKGYSLSADCVSTSTHV